MCQQRLAIVIVHKYGPVYALSDDLYYIKPKHNFKKDQSLFACTARQVAASSDK